MKALGYELFKEEQLCILLIIHDLDSGSLLECQVQYNMQ